MRYFICFILAIIFASTNGIPTTSQEGLGQAMRTFLDAIKRGMECPMGATPILAPFTMDSLKLEKVYPGLDFHMNITNLYIGGLNTFQIVGSDYDSTTQSYTLYIDTPTAQVLGEYKLDATVTAAGVPLHLTGDGFLDMESVDGRIILAMNFVTNSNGHLTMSNLKFKDMSCGQFNARNTGFMENINFSNYLNSNMESGITLLNAQLVDVVMTPYADMLMDIFNPILKQFSSVDQFTSALIAVSGNSTVGVFGLPLCN
ncbi:hypothetical protein ACFFRR_006614 [Megaselia abdita]